MSAIDYCSRNVRQMFRDRGVGSMRERKQKLGEIQITITKIAPNKAIQMNVYPKVVI